jgi:lipopolysaccharide export system permease protein
LKKLDKLILQAFSGPFFLTFAVVEFILLTQYMLKYMDEFVGKDLGFLVFAELIMYFSVTMAPVALPLAVLLSSLMTFGNLGEHHELTAIKSSGISLLRILRPVLAVVLLITIGAFFFNNYVVPKSNLKAYSLLWDIRQKKPSLDLKAGSFYNGLPGYSIKVNKKLSDGTTMLEMMIYDHTSGRGNTNVTLADSGKMYTALQDKYLMLEMYRGVNYNEQQSDGSQSFVRSRFKQSKIVFSLESFDLERTKEELFAGNKMMKRIDELKRDNDSINRQLSNENKMMPVSLTPYYSYYKPPVQEKAKSSKSTAAVPSLPREVITARTLPPVNTGVVKQALEKARALRSFTASMAERQQTLRRETRYNEIEVYRKFTQSAACLIMFLIGAPLGAIIKKGGLGVPVLISIIFFIVFYVLSILGEKWGREEIVVIPAGMWLANSLLLPIGIFFLFQARSDSSLLELNFWRKPIQKIRLWWNSHSFGSKA